MRLIPDEQSRFRLGFAEGTESRAAEAACLLNFLEVTNGARDARIHLAPMTLWALRKVAQAEVIRLAAEGAKEKSPRGEKSDG